MTIEPELGTRYQGDGFSQIAKLVPVKTDPTLISVLLRTTLSYFDYYALYNNADAIFLIFTLIPLLVCDN